MMISLRENSNSRWKMMLTLPSSCTGNFGSDTSSNVSNEGIRERYQDETFRITSKNTMTMPTMVMNTIDDSGCFAGDPSEKSGSEKEKYNKRKEDMILKNSAFRKSSMFSSPYRVPSDEDGVYQMLELVSLSSERLSLLRAKKSHPTKESLFDVLHRRGKMVKPEYSQNPSDEDCVLQMMDLISSSTSQLTSLPRKEIVHSKHDDETTSISSHRMVRSRRLVSSEECGYIDYGSCSGGYLYSSAKQTAPERAINDTHAVDLSNVSSHKMTRSRMLSSLSKCGYVSLTVTPPRQPTRRTTTSFIKHNHRRCRRGGGGTNKYYHDVVVVVVVNCDSTTNEQQRSQRRQRRRGRRPVRLLTAE